MKCTSKEQSSCNAEKMGCDGCAYDDTKERIKELQKEVSEAEKRGWNDITVEIDILKRILSN